MGKDTVKSKIQILNLNHDKYAVSDMVSGQNLGVLTRDKLAEGVELDFQAGQMRMLKCVPTA